MSWSRQLIALWNGRREMRLIVKAPTDFVISVVERNEPVWFHWDERGGLSIPNKRAASTVAKLSAKESTWRDILSSSLEPEQAVMRGEVEYAGSLSYLTERLELLRALIEIARDSEQ